MLQVLNSKERNQAFTKFLIFFLVTVTIVVFAIYFDYQVPTKFNEVLTEEVNTQRKDNNNQRNFVALMQEARNLLDTMSKSGSSINLVDVRLTGKLQQLAAFPQNDSSLYAKMNKNIVETFVELQSLKKAAINSTQLNAELESLRTQLRDAKADVDRWRGMYERLIGAPVQ